MVFGIRLLCDVYMEIVFLVFQYNNNLRDLGLLVPRGLRISPYHIVFTNTKNVLCLLEELIGHVLRD